MIARKRSSLPSLTTTWLLFPPQLSHQRCVNPREWRLCPYELVHPGTEGIAEHAEEDDRYQAQETQSQVRDGTHRSASTDTTSPASVVIVNPRRRKSVKAPRVSRSVRSWLISTLLMLAAVTR